MNLSCDVVIDLVSLYKDGLASEGSRIAVEEHLKDCPSCRKFYKLYNSTEKDYSTREDEPRVGDVEQRYTTLSRRMRRKRNIFTIVVAGCSVLTATSILLYVLEKVELPDSAPSKRKLFYLKPLK